MTLSNKPDIDDSWGGFRIVDSVARETPGKITVTAEELKALYQRLLQVIGADEPSSMRGGQAWEFRNNLRAAQRKALAEMFGVKE